MSIDADLAIGIAAKPATRLSYALAHNRIPVLSSLELVNGSGRPIRDVLLRAGVSCLDEEIATPVEQPIDELAIGPRKIGSLGLQLKPDAMRRIEERRPGQVWASLCLHDGTELVRQTWETQVLSPQQWLDDPSRPELSGMALAAFVQPNHPAIEPVLAAARQILERRTGSSATQGYQSGPQRVDEIARAVYEALLARKIKYSDPPASWSDVGQKIRTPEQVIVGQVGTCLDTAVTYAACLEQAGLAPLVWLIHGHAFTAYWRSREGAKEEPVIADINRLVNIADTDLMVKVETTMLTNGAPFAEAVVEANRRSSNPQIIESAVNVLSARIRNVVPLPAVHRQDDGSTVVVVYQAPQLVITEREKAETSARVGRVVEDPSPKRFQFWKTQLLDLSRRNRLIAYNRERHGIPLHIPSGSLGTFEDVLHAGHKLGLLPHDQIDEFHREAGARLAQEIQADDLKRMMVDQQVLYVARSADTYVKDLRKIAREARTREQQSGANQLFVTLGKLHWVSADGHELASPVFLVPARLTSTGGRKPVFILESDETGISSPNFSLVEKLKQDLDLSVDELANPRLDEFGIDIEGSLKALRKAIFERKLDNFRVDDNAHLTIVNFTKFRLWKDLDEHWQHFQQNSVVRHLVHTPERPFDDPAAPEGPMQERLNLRCPIPADGSQLSAIERTVRGESFVLEGPPGTGKSQTITNVIAASMAAGKRVLFVAEKQAALDVVQSRLESVGLAPLCLELHAKGAKLQQLRDQILEAIDYAPKKDWEAYEAAEARRAAALHPLEQYPRRLHDPNPMGYSVWSARQMQLRLGDGPSVEIPDEFLQKDRAVVQRVTATLRELPLTAADAGARGRHPWALAEVTELDPALLEALQSAVPSMSQALHGLLVSPMIEAAIDAIGEPADFARLVTVLDADSLRAADLMHVRTPAWHHLATGMLTEVATANRAMPAVLHRFRPDVLGADLDGWLATARAANELGMLARGRQLKLAAAPLSQYARSGHGIVPKELVQILIELNQAKQTGDVVRSRASSVPGIVLDASWNPWLDDALAVVNSKVQQTHEMAGMLTQDTEFGRALTEIATSASRASEFEAAAVRLLADWWAHFNRLLGVDGDSFRRWLDGRRFLTVWRETQPEWDRDLTARFLRLGRWARLRSGFTPLVAEGLTDLVEEISTGRLPMEHADEAFRRGLATAVLARELAQRQLDGFDGKRHNRAVNQFAEADEEVLSLEATAIADDIVASRSGDVRQRRGPVGELRLEVTKTRGRKKNIRSLLETYPETIQDLMPCFLMSPDSVASFLNPSRVKFDVVLFDEASQITVAEAIGTMGRGTSVVVVGDSKQMPPSDPSGGFSFDDDLGPPEQADDMIVDAESILSECVESGLPREWLSWHYRSQDEALIAFSNTHYYDGKLSSFPSPRVPLANTGLRFVRVDGEFIRTGPRTQQRRNPAEAQAIVVEIERRFADLAGPRRSIGVVTMNKEQAELIYNMLSRSKVEGVPEALKLGMHDNDSNGLIVKNLENVQGDERDVVLLSVAFSAKAPGERVPLLMGALTHQGGERRLNVAVTRAKRELIVYCSFDPPQLQPSPTSSLGIRHLKDYIELAAGVQPAEGSKEPDAQDLDRHLDDIRQRIEARGLVVRPNVGMSDFKVDLALATREYPDIEVVGVLLDGPAWRRRKNANDRDRLPIEVLEGGMGWARVMRIWLPSWLVEPDEILDEILETVHQEVGLAQARAAEAAAEAEAIAAARAEALATAQTSEVVDEDEVPDIDSLIDVITPRDDEAATTEDEEPEEDAEHEEDDEGGRPPGRRPSLPDPPAGLMPYQRWNARPVPPVLDVTKQQLVAVLGEIVQAEGPMLAELAYRRYVTASGGMRLGTAVKSTLNQAAASLARGRLVSQIKDTTQGQMRKTLYIAGTPPVLVREPGGRDLEKDVPPSEVKALLEMLGMSGSDPEESVMREALRIYGASGLTQSRIRFLRECAGYRMG